MLKAGNVRPFWAGPVFAALGPLKPSSPAKAARQQLNLSYQHHVSGTSAGMGTEMLTVSSCSYPASTSHISRTDQLLRLALLQQC